MLELRHAVKSFGAVRALTDGSVRLRAGTVHALLGENGAGKSTLVKILAGVHQPDSGTLSVLGRRSPCPGPAPPGPPASRSSTRSRPCSPTCRWPRTCSSAASRCAAGARRIDRRAMNKAAAVFERLGVQLDPQRPARGLSIADQQVVEIGKALILDARVIVMDEPTAALSAAEVDRLFAVTAHAARRRARRCCSSRTAWRRSSPSAPRSP